MTNENENPNDERQENNRALSDKLTEKLINTRTVFLFGEIDQKLAEKICSQLLILQEMGDEPIKIYINSQGGHVDSGDTIHDMIKFVRPKVYVIGTGWVASAGITIYLAAEKENRLSMPNTRYMIHQPLGGVQGQASDIKIEADEIIKMRLRLNKLISDATGQPVERINEDTLRNYWMDSKQAIDYGIVGRVIRSIDEI
ncbi:MAG: ATP-dependent Clp protease proteolytic subunit [Clostridiales bacterium]|jgi:ATP-dependent Clp protease protease subunit|nr:ATP-dependent Clp protease proteolytic subunit [Clostridiales bacterium]